jgi:hypothetical protein
MEGQTMSDQVFTTRRAMIEVLLGLGAASVAHGALDFDAWRSYESVEEAWIRDRHALLIAQAPAAAGAAQLDLDLKLAELRRRAMQFQHLLKRNPGRLRGDVWQLSWVPFSDKDKAQLQTSDAAYGRLEEHIRGLSTALRTHPEYEEFQRAQTRLWKTPEYKEIHRRYSGRMQGLVRHSD